MSKTTANLVKLIEKHASDPNSDIQAQELIKNGADITSVAKNGFLIQCVIAEEKRQRLIAPARANQCLKLAELLRNAATTKLKATVLSKSYASIDYLQRLVEVQASLNDPNFHDSFGLLGSLLKQTEVPIRIDIVKFLLKQPTIKALLIVTDNECQTLTTLSKNNPGCTPEVVQYIQEEFDSAFNEIPKTSPNIDKNTLTNLIRVGANLEKVDAQGNTILLNAALTNNVELVRVFISVGSNTEHKNNDGFTALEIARKASTKNPALIAALEAQKVNADFKDFIVKHGSRVTIEKIEEYLDCGADINAMLTRNNTFLHLLIMNKCDQTVMQALIDNFHADISKHNLDGHRAIEECIKIDKNPFPYLEGLFKSKKMTSDLFYNEYTKKTILQFAIEINQKDTAAFIENELNRRLLNIAEKIDKMGKDNQNIVSDIDTLRKGGVDINKQHSTDEYEGWPILHIACRKGNLEIVRLLIERFTADYLGQTKSGEYLISIASVLGNLAIIEYLFSLPNMKANVANNIGDTPLHIAVKNNNFVIARYFILWGADAQVQNQDRQTPMDLAKQAVLKTKQDEINNKKIIQLLGGLKVPADLADEKPTQNKNPVDVNLDVCMITGQPPSTGIKQTTFDEEMKLGAQGKVFLFSNSYNDQLANAAKTGAVDEAKAAIAKGADIRYRKDNKSIYEIAITSASIFMTSMANVSLGPVERGRQVLGYNGCNEISNMVKTIAQKKMLEAIDKGDASRFLAFHTCGAPIDPSLVKYVCNASDSVEIFCFLLEKSKQCYDAFMNDTSEDRPVNLARKNGFKKIVQYINYRLSTACVNAIAANDLEMTKKFVLLGASVETNNSMSINHAIKFGNIELVKYLCNNGARFPSEWLSTEKIILDRDVAQSMKPEITRIIDQSLINRRLRLAAANGDINTLIKCEELGANINSMNIHGSTALLCAVQHGNYFPVVHNLISRGASILHSNQNEPMSIIELAKRNKYDNLVTYMSQNINNQFISAILNGDQQSAEKLSQLGADFNYKDEQGRTALHYAVESYGIDFVSWLCECGSSVLVSDENGDYPITLATEKGDYALVELFVLRYPATKRQTNKAGLTALQIAQKLKFTRIAQLIETGKGVSEDDVKEDTMNDNKHDRIVLLNACRDGQLKTIQEFIAHRYQSKQEKSEICAEMIRIAKTYKQYQILAILEPYFKNELKLEVASDEAAGGGLALSERYKKILLGFLGSLSKLIADSPVLLDPSDPSTYDQFFTGIRTKVSEHTAELESVKDDKDIKKLVEKDQDSSQEQLALIQQQLESLMQERESAESRMEEMEERLLRQEDLTALQRKELMKNKEIHQQQITTYECSIELFQRQHEATANRQKLMEFFKKSANLIMFYRTIENRLQALFHSALAAQGGYVHKEDIASVNKAINIVKNNVPIINIIKPVLKSLVGPILSKLDEKQQKREFYNISNLGNIEELDRLASETAGLLTLYYRQQIEMIDVSGRLTQSHIFNDTEEWMRELYTVRPEHKHELAVVIVAEYITAWVIDALKIGKDINPIEPIPQQLWLQVAKIDPTGLKKTSATNNLVNSSAGKKMIPLNYINSLGAQVTEMVQLRYLIGCVSVITNDGTIYQYEISSKQSSKELRDLEIFGYVFIKPFTLNDKISQAVIDGRNLYPARKDKNGNVLTKFDDIEAYAKTYTQGISSEMDQNFTLNVDAAGKIAKLMQEKKMFVSPSTLEQAIRQSKDELELSISVLRESGEERAKFYQTSIDAAHEQIKVEAQNNRVEMQRNNDENYRKTTRRLEENAQRIGEELEQTIQNRLTTIEKMLDQKTKEILDIVQAANEKSIEAMEKAKQAVETSKTCLEQAHKLVQENKEVMTLAARAQEEFRKTITSCEERVKQTTQTQKSLFEQEVAKIRKNFETDVGHMKTKANESVQAAKESSRSAKEIEESMSSIRKSAKEEVELIKSENKKLLGAIKDSEKKVEELERQAREAQRQATKAAEMTHKSSERVGDLIRKLDDDMKSVKTSIKTAAQKARMPLDAEIDRIGGYVADLNNGAAPDVLENSSQLHSVAQ